MDAAAYFALSDRIRDLRTAGDAVALRHEIEHATPHLVERRALERRLDARLSALGRSDREILRQVAREPGRERVPAPESATFGAHELVGDARPEGRRASA